MDSNNRRQHDALAAVRRLCAAHEDVFRGNPVAEQALAQLNASTDGAATSFKEHIDHLEAAANSTNARRAARKALRGSLKAVARTSHVVAIDAGADAQVSMPKGVSDKALVAFGQAVADRVTPLADRYTAHKLAPTVISGLPSQVATLAQTMADQSDHRRGHKVARRQAEAHLRKGAEVADVLQRIYDNAFAGDQQAIERWKEARRVGPARSVEPPTAPAPTAAAPAAPPATAKTA